MGSLFIRRSLLSLPPDAVQPAAPSPHYRMVYFDVSSVDLTNSTLVKAEFRIFRAPNPLARASEQRVEIYQVHTQAATASERCDQEKKDPLCWVVLALSSPRIWEF